MIKKLIKQLIPNSFKAKWRSSLEVPSKETSFDRFVLYDICSLMRRPLDEALFQSDFLFVRIDADLRKDHRWTS